MTLLIRGLGTAVPAHFISQVEAAAMAAQFCCETDQQTRLLSTLYRRTGVRTRHSVVLEDSTNGTPASQSYYAPAINTQDPGPTTSSRMLSYESAAGALVIAAARRALQAAEIDAERVTHLITVSCSGFYAPGIDIELLGELPLSPAVARTHIGFMGCHGTMNGLRVAHSFVQANPQAVVLLCAVELCSLHQQYGWDPERVVANALFADGAAAVVATAEGEGAPAGRDEKHRETGKRVSDRSRVDRTDQWRLVANGSYVVPESRDLMSWRIGDHGFEMTLSPQLPDLILRNLRPWLNEWLSQHGLTSHDVASWAIHPGGPRILSAVAEAADLDSEQLCPSRTVLANYGNMSSPTVLFILDELSQSKGERCVLLAFGPGITIEAALLQRNHSD
ncbi:type III polyketide synthase [bacterium]|nr:type III polyketide synthase [bacterium]